MTKDRKRMKKGSSFREYNFSNSKKHGDLVDIKRSSAILCIQQLWGLNWWNGNAKTYPPIEWHRDIIFTIFMISIFIIFIFLVLHETKQLGTLYEPLEANYPTYPNIGLRRGLTSWKIEPIRDSGHQNSFLSILRSNHSSFKRLQGICLQEKHKERKHLSASNVQFKTTNPSSFRGETAGTPNQSIGENHGFSVEQPWEMHLKLPNISLKSMGFDLQAMVHHGPTHPGIHIPRALCFRGLATGTQERQSGNMEPSGPFEA